MIQRIQSLSYARMLTLVASGLGVALTAIYAGAADRKWAILLILPFLLGLVVSVTSMERRTRIVFLWLISLGAGFVAALTIFSGIGFFLLAIAVAYLSAAWQENRADE
jgi:uncharacterized membrane protein